MTRSEPGAHRLLRAALATAFTAGFLVIAWRVAGDQGFVIAWITHVVLMAWSAVVGIPRRGLTARWFSVHPSEPGVYRALGVRVFDRILSLIGWNRLIEAERQFDGTRSGLAELDHNTRRSEVAHLACTVVVVGLAGAAAPVGLSASAVWLLALTVPLHLYPVGLQRLLRSRIHRLTATLVKD